MSVVLETARYSVYAARVINKHNKILDDTVLGPLELRRLRSRKDSARLLQYVLRLR